MSSLPFVIIGTIVVIFTMLFVFSRLYQHGYGMVLIRKDDGTIWVVSVLADSPAAKCGIVQDTQVLKVGGVFMEFKDHTSFHDWLESNKLLRTKKQTWHFGGGLRVTLESDVIKKNIPTVWNKNWRTYFKEDGRVPPPHFVFNTV